ncbi:vitamin K epoxide reductase family protein [Amycolatopsis sp. NPDC051373]|uniref:vitamin K epoxide reductase family protein n=1 Tax=Amycolatopsis sp. NPDC051373 TaxID=3155801 RepID=UPI00344D1768
MTATGTTARGPAWLYLVGGALGLAAAIALTLEKIAKLRDPAYVPSCSINPVISCGSVMDSSQASAFGFPNPLIGIAAFSVVVTFGVVLLTGYTAPRWVWLGMQLGATFGVGFVHWLIFASLYRIHALCPYCMVVWIVTIATFWYTTLHNLRGTAFGGLVRRVHSGLLALWYVAVVVLVLQAFWPYWSTVV